MFALNALDPSMPLHQQTLYPAGDPLYNSVLAPNALEEGAEGDASGSATVRDRLSSSS